MKKSYKMRCEKCGNTMIKWGKTNAGKPRYKCKICNTTQVKRKENITKQNELKMFVKWLIDSTKITDKIPMSRSTFNRKIRWCWGVIPKIKSDVEPSDFIVVDATYINKELCLLVARNKKNVLGFRWAKSETYEGYYDLLKSLKEPRFVIGDGHASITKASKKLWKNVGIQRCLVHIMRHSESKLGKRSSCEINHIFRRHINKLSSVDTAKKSSNWLKKFESLYEIHREFIEEKKPVIDIETGEFIRSFRTHKNLFSVCSSIHNLIKNNMLFLFVNNDIPNNSNCLEGGINSPLKNLLRCHRGISLVQQMRMCEWYLLSRSNTSINDFISSLDFDKLPTHNDT